MLAAPKKARMKHCSIEDESPDDWTQTPVTLQFPQDVRFQPWPAISTLPSFPTLPFIWSILELRGHVAAATANRAHGLPLTPVG